MTAGSSVIPASITSILNDIITHQEGGYVLTENKNDPDGGWTYAGVTAKTFNHYCELYGEAPVKSLQDMKECLAAKDDLVQDAIHHIYNEEYCEPLWLDRLPEGIRGPVLSSAINCGVETAVKILQRIVEVEQDGKMGSKTLAAIERFVLYWAEPDHGYSLLKNAFLREWTRHYIKLVEANAKEWYLTAKDYEHELLDGIENTKQDNIDAIKVPEVFRAGDLEGWFNRVEFWR